MPDSIFLARGLSAGYGSKIIVSGIDIEARSGEVICLLGPNGCGKSTTIRTVAGMLPGMGGEIFICGRRVEEYSSKGLARVMSVVLTERTAVQMMTSFEIVLMGRLPYANYFGGVSPEDRRIAMEAMADVGAASLATRDFASLSDGERQKVMIARALAQQPKLMVLDEPTSHLDIRHKLEVLRILRRLADERGIAILLSLHDLDMAQKTADRLILLKNGKVFASGCVSDVLTKQSIEGLYDIDGASYSELLGGIEIHNSSKPRVMVLCGGNRGTPVLRMLARLKTGVVAVGTVPGEVDYEVARAMNIEVMDDAVFAETGCDVLVEIAVSASAAAEHGSVRRGIAGGDFVQSGASDDIRGRIVRDAKNLGAAVISARNSDEAVRSLKILLTQRN